MAVDEPIVHVHVPGEGWCSTSFADTVVVHKITQQKLVNIICTGFSAVRPVDYYSVTKEPESAVKYGLV